MKASILLLHDNCLSRTIEITDKTALKFFNDAIERKISITLSYNADLDKYILIASHTANLQILLKEYGYIKK